MQRKTLIIILFVFVLFLFTACQPAAPAPLQTSEVLETSEVLPTVTPTKNIATATPEKVVINGTEAVQRGDSYFYANPANNREVEVAKIVDGKIEQAEFLNYKLVSCTASKEEILANVLPYDLVDPQGADIGLANKIAMVADNEPFPPDVVTIGQTVIDPTTGKEIVIGITMEPRTFILNKDINSPFKFDAFRMRWNEGSKNFFDANPEKVPYKNKGCGMVLPASDKPSVAIDVEWHNPDGSNKFMTLFADAEFFFTQPRDSFIFSKGITEEVSEEAIQQAPSKLGARILSDPNRVSILQNWGTTGVVPDEAEKFVFIGQNTE